jgi:hypothetical protein
VVVDDGLAGLENTPTTIVDDATGSNHVVEHARQEFVLAGRCAALEQR